MAWTCGERPLNPQASDEATEDNRNFHSVHSRAQGILQSPGHHLATATPKIATAHLEVATAHLEGCHSLSLHPIRFQVGKVGNVSVSSAEPTLCKQARVLTLAGDLQLLTLNNSRR